MDSQFYQKMLYEKHQKLILSKRVAAEELQSSESTVDRLRKEGKLISKKIGGRIFFPIDVIADYLSD